MESKLWSLVDGQAFVQWLIIFVLVVYFVYKEWPGFWSRIKDQAKREDAPDAITARLDRIETDIQEIKEKLGRDYDRINVVEERQQEDKRVVREIKSEQGIIMRALLASLGGLQELGANGSTEKAKEEIINWLNRQAHDGED